MFALVTIGARADQVIAGTAITLGAVGLTGTIYRQAYGAAGAGLDLPTLAPIADPRALDRAAARPAFFLQPAPTYLAVARRAGRVVAPLPHARRPGAAGHGRVRNGGARRRRAPRLVRGVATLIGGGIRRAAGATLVLAQVGTFAERMTAGRGYVAIAIVVLGRWHPVGVAVAALAFGAATALQFLFQTLGLDLPYQLFLMLPYVLALLALAGVVGRVRAPADLGKPWRRVIRRIYSIPAARCSQRT